MKCRKSTKTTPGAAKNDPKRSPRRPKTTPRGAQDDQKSDPERQDEKRTEPRRSWDRLGPPPRARPPARAHPRGSIWEAKTAPKSIPKRSKIEAKNQEEKKPIQDDLGPVLGRSWAVLGRHLGPKNVPNHYKTRGFVDNRFFDVKTVRRRLWDQLWPTKAPK